MTEKKKLPNRREWLGAMGALPLAGALSGQVEAAGAQNRSSARHAPAGPTIVTQDDLRECARLRDLDLSAPEVAAKQKQMPTGKIGDLTWGRLMSGSNLISMNMHARDLGYVNSLARHYNTEERILMTLKKCEEWGVNGIVLKDHNFRHFKLSRYWDEWGGRMKWIADVITTDINKYRKRLESHLDLGAAAAYLWGGATDIWYHEKKPGKIIKAFEIMKEYDLPVGIAAHRFEPIKFCVNEGLEPDFYMLTLHHDRYWSAHPEANRSFIEMYRPNSPDHDRYHDNMFCHSHEEVIAFMQDVKVPWIAYKVLAAGAIPPKDGLKYAFDNGADFICLGMFDYQVVEDVKLTQKYIAQARKRKRPWYG